MDEPGKRVTALKLDYAAPARRESFLVSHPYTPFLIFFGLIAVVILFSVRNTNHSTRGYSYRGKCASNLHQIGLGILLYCNDYNGNYPDSFATIAVNEQLTPVIFTCPSTNDTPSTASTTQEVAADFAKPGNVSYLYLGKGLTEKTVLPNQVIAYEPLSNHTDGIDVLLGDGSVEFVNAARAAKIIADADGGVRPVKLPP